MESTKPVHTLVLDAGSIIKNEPSVSTLLKQSEGLITVPAVVSEIKDAATRSRFETTLQPFLTLRSPSATSITFVTNFARKTGDLAVLSKPDIQIIALAYEIECERNGGDWRLRRAPGQRRVNGAPPLIPKSSDEEPSKVQQLVDLPNLPTDETTAPTSQTSQTSQTSTSKYALSESLQEQNDVSETSAAMPAPDSPPTTQDQHPEISPLEDDISSGLAETNLDEEQLSPEVDVNQTFDSIHSTEGSQSESDSEGWITPSNLRKKQARDTGSSTTQASEPKTMQVAVLTTDFAMQNVILQINLNLLSPSLSRVKHLRTFVLRCHACFQVTKDMSKQFCPKCGQPSLTRVSCSTNASGEFKLHLKQNMQWNRRGDKYSIPKAVHGSAHGRVKGGGKGGWGNDLILAEDQKEYQRAANDEKKLKLKDLMDQDDLPSILTGDRGRSGGRIKIGAGRTVNARKR